MKQVSDMRNHIIVCGGGRMGRIVVEEMKRSNRSFVLVESNEARLSNILKQNPDVLVVEGDATKEQILMSAGIDRAAGLAACLPNDADNILVCLTARGLCPTLTIVARAVDEETIAATIDFIQRKTKEGKPWFAWWNGTRMHFRTHVKKELRGISGQDEYSDGMVEHDRHVSLLA